MQNTTEHEIEKLQNSLILIRKAGGWSAEEFGDFIGVTKQTISNLENKKTRMTKTQYIAIRAVLDYEIANRPEDEAFSSVVNMCLNSSSLSESDIKKAQAFIDGASKAKLDYSTIKTGLAALIGVAMVEAIRPITGAPRTGVVTEWLAKIIRGK